MPTVPGWPVAFRGSRAIAAGLVTRDRLRGPRYQRLLPDVYGRSGDRPDLVLRSLAAYRLVEGRGVLSGHSAATRPPRRGPHPRGARADQPLLRLADGDPAAAVDRRLRAAAAAGAVGGAGPRQPHTDPDRVLRDVGRYTRLVDQSWRIYRYTNREVYHAPERIIAELTRARNCA